MYTELDMINYVIDITVQVIDSFSFLGNLVTILCILFRVSKERGRVIDFKEVLYGYIRWHPTLALEYIIDMLLLYKKYRGKKMTVPVRRHAYLQVSYGLMHFSVSFKGRNLLGSLCILSNNV